MEAKDVAKAQWDVGNGISEGSVISKSAGWRIASEYRRTQTGTSLQHKIKSYIHYMVLVRRLDIYALKVMGEVPLETLRRNEGVSKGRSRKFTGKANEALL